MCWMEGCAKAFCSQILVLDEVAETFMGGNIKVHVFPVISPCTVSFMVLTLNQSRKTVKFFLHRESYLFSYPLRELELILLSSHHG